MRIAFVFCFVISFSHRYRVVLGVENACRNLPVGKLAFKAQLRPALGRNFYFHERIAVFKIHGSRRLGARLP